MAGEATGSPTGNPNVRYEETLAIGDADGADGLVGWLRVAVGFLVVSSLVSLVVVVVATRGVATRVGGMDALRALVGRLVADRPVVVVAFVLPGLLVVLVGVVFVRSFAGSVGRAVDGVVHVRVTDDGIRVEREGRRYWQSSGVDVPFDAITAVEYADPEASSFRVELRDVRAPKFFAGRSRDWVRLERAHGPAVYVGSDRPRELAAAIARRVPGDVTARPF